MLAAMQRLALAFLAEEVGLSGEKDPIAWYLRIRQEQPGLLLRFLVQDVSKEKTEKDTPRFYVLQADATDKETAILQVHELTKNLAAKLPFNKPSGPNAPALGPVIKRMANVGGGYSPKRSTQDRTLNHWRDIAESNQPWSAYYAEAQSCWLRKRLKFNGEVIQAKSHAFQEAVDRINEKRTVLVAFKDAANRLPGDVAEYGAYLLSILEGAKYETNDAPGVESKTCALCGTAPVKVYSNSLKGAGLNIANVDRAGAFPGLNPAMGCDTFGVCAACADLLYVFCRHVSSRLKSRVGGEIALIVPTLGWSAPSHQSFFRSISDWLYQAEHGKGIKAAERQLLQKLGEERAVTSIDIVWAEFGELIQNVRGTINDVLPSRLEAIATVNKQILSVKSPIFPENRLDGFNFDVSLSILGSLFNRPGGKPAQRSNESRRLWELRREVAEAVYHGRECPARFMEEALITARFHFDSAADSDAAVYLFTSEGYSETKKTGFLTVAGWVKQLARFLYYLECVGVKMPEKTPPPQPTIDWLKPYFGPESSLDTLEKSFAFLLGALYGKLLTVQGARGVNVGANALTWLRRLSLSGADLPELYTKVRSKMLEYGAERSRKIRELNAELGELGYRLGNTIELDEKDTCYFLLLGQSLAVKMMPPKKKKEQQP